MQIKRGRYLAWFLLLAAPFLAAQNGLAIAYSEITGHKPAGDIPHVWK